MGLLSFVKEAGEKLFGGSKATAAPSAPAAAGAAPAAPAPDLGQLNKTAADAIAAYITSMKLPVEQLAVQFDGATGTVTVSGQTPDQATKEKVLLCCGNVQSVTAVNDMLTVAQPEPEAQYYTVAKGDTLSKVSKQYYGDANKYMTIFEANKPMLSHPDKIYPGQVLRIPPQP